MESRAAARAAARAAIHHALEALPPEDRVVVLEDALFETRPDAPRAPLPLRALAPSTEVSVPPPAAVAPALTAPAEATEGEPAAEEEKPLWGRILAWCREHPQHSGYYDVRSVAVTLLPQLPPAKAWQRVYVEVKRKSRQGRGRMPLFDFQPGSKQRFRLLEAGEAQGKGGAARRI